MIEWRQTFPKSKQNNQNQNNWKHYSVVFSPSRKTAFKDRFKKKEIKLVPILFCYASIIFFFFCLSPRSSFPPHWNRHKSQRGAKEEPLYSRLYFSHDWSEKSFETCSNPQCVHTDIYVYIFILGVQQQQQRQTSQKKKKKEKDDIPLPSCCRIAIGEIETQPTDQTRWQRQAKMMMMAISR